MTRLIPALLFCAALSACSTPEQQPITRPTLSSFTEAELKGSADAMLKKFEVDEEQAFGLMKRLDEMLADPVTKDRMANMGCSAVGVFQFGSGGLLIAGGTGHGLVTFAGGSALEPFSAQAMSVGATVGGDNTYGILLVFGLENEERFSSRYTFRGTGGTIASTSFKVGQAEPELGKHVIQYLGHGTGLKASADVAKGTLVLDREQDGGE